MLRLRPRLHASLCATWLGVAAITGCRPESDATADESTHDTRGEDDAPPALPAPPASADTAATSSAEPPIDDDPPPETTFAAQRARLYGVMRRELRLDEPTMNKVAAIFEASPLLGQGRPDDTTHPMSRTECRAIRRDAKFVGGDARCGKPNMVPLWDPSRGETASDAKVCIDQYEFPNIPCEYPVTYASAFEAASLCEAVGERLCDAHEWEGACAGAVHPADEEYFFGKQRPLATLLHNQAREIRWAYGPTKDHSKCGTMSKKSDRCDSTGLVHCGSNTYPTGAFPECVSPFGVYDQHGNAAEHMNLPMSPEELGSRGGHGLTEMKGSWFVFGRATIQPHEDDCRWRAKDWHPSRLMDPGSHRNYHLGFRCCRDLGTPG
jgi:hypothetical protein